MDLSTKPKKRVYVVLLFVEVDPEYYRLKKKKRAKLTKPHMEELSKHLEDVSITTVKGTGLGSDVMIEILESESLVEIEKMIETYKAGAKSSFAKISNIMVTEKCMELKSEDYRKRTPRGFASDLTPLPRRS